MNLFTLKHRLNNFETELAILDKDEQTKMFDANENEVRRNRRSFLQNQIDTLVVSIGDLKWEIAVKK